MPVIKHALRHSKHKGWKPGTKDKKKYQTRFDHDPNVLTMAKIKASVKQLSGVSVKPAYSVIPPQLLEEAEKLGYNMANMILDDLVEGNLTTGKWADEDTSFDP